MRPAALVQRAVAGLLLIASLLGAAVAWGQSAGNQIAGPFTVTLPSTQVFSFSQSFNAPAPVQGSYLLRVQLSAPNSLSTLSVTLNGAQVLSLSDFAGGKTSVDKLVTLAAANSLAAQIAGAKGTKITLTVFGVSLPKPTALSPSPLALNAGAGGTLTASLSPTPTAPGTLSVSSSAPGVASVPSAIAFGSGQTSVAIPVSAVASGSASVSASVNGGQAAATVSVNALPTVSIGSPANGALYNAPATIVVTANAADADGTVAKVEFFDGGALVGTVTAAPYAVTLNSVPAGVHTLTARATDNKGALRSSAAVQVTVDAPPVVALSAPAGGTVYAGPASVLLSANATIEVGSIARVDFYQGASLIGTAPSAPYTFNWTNVAAGSYSLKAIATNDAGGSTASAPVAITVDAPPVVSLDGPASGAVYASGGTILLTATAADTVGTVSKVEFFQGATLIGTATSAPYTFGWTNVAAGTYSLKAIATNDAGQTGASSTISIAVNAPPQVALTAPATGASFSAPANIPLAASVSDTVGTITRVDFYQGDTLITTRTSPPYSFTWTAVPAGAYSLTAVATNDAAQTSTSAAVPVTVTAAAGRMYFIQTDHLNTPRLIADSTGATVWRNDNTEPFGDSVPDENPSGLGAFEFPLVFMGTYRDKETNKLQNGYRELDPARGQYLESDLIGLKGGLNTYAHVNGNPIGFVDPNGLLKCQWIGLILRCEFGPPGFPGGTGDSDLDRALKNPTGKGRSGDEEKGCCPDCGAPPGPQIDRVPPSRPHPPCPGDHWVYFEYHQSPYPDCKCRLVRRFGGCLGQGDYPPGWSGGQPPRNPPGRPDRDF